MADGDRHRRSSSVPLLALGLLAASFFLFTVFHTVDLINSHTTLSAAHAQQTQSVNQAIALRTQLQTLAARTAQLAAGGDKAAKTVVASMQRAGVALHPPNPHNE